MNVRSSKNEGVKLLAEFVARALPLPSKAPTQDSPRPASRSTNEGIALLEDFQDRAEAVRGQENTPRSDGTLGKGCPAQSGATCVLELVIHVDANSLAEDDQNRLLEGLSQLLPNGQEMNIREKTPRGVKLGVMLTQEQAEKFYRRACGAIEWAARVDIRFISNGLIGAEAPQ